MSIDKIFERTMDDEGYQFNQLNQLNQPNIRERRFLVDSNFHRWRLDRFLANRLGRLSRTRANKIARQGDIRIDSRRRGQSGAIKPSLRLHVGDCVIIRELLGPEDVQDEEVLWIYKDSQLLALSKPSGMLTHETVSLRLNTVDAFLQRQGYEEAEAAHRLDRETSGIMICSATKEWIRPLRELFAQNPPKKIYRALVLDPDNLWQIGQTATLETPLGPVEDSVLSVRMGKGSLSATTHVEVLGKFEHPEFGMMSDLRVCIVTGRQHQIRVHLYMYGTPIAGDKLYGQTDEFFMDICDRPNDPSLLGRLAFVRHALHAFSIEFEHPESGKTVLFEAPLPEDIWSFLS